MSQRSIKPRGQAEPVTGVNVNSECRLRVRNTEKFRKHRLGNPASSRGPYVDDDPPEEAPGDGGGQEPMEEDGDDNGGPTYARARTCPHYRQLTARRAANLAHATFVPSKQVNCCSAGGKKSKYGAHDIEDLVSFGVDPYRQKEVALYRQKPEESFGLSLREGRRGSGTYVSAVKPGTPAEINGFIQVDDKLLRVNGSDVSRSDPATVVNKIKGTRRGDPLMLDVTRGGSGSLSSTDGGCKFVTAFAMICYTSSRCSLSLDHSPLNSCSRLLKRGVPILHLASPRKGCRYRLRALQLVSGIH